MYSYIIGKLSEKYSDRMIIDNNAIGYEILSSLNSINSVNIGDEIKIFTKLIVKEDDLQIVGFTNKDELILYNLISSVSKIGPKLSLASLSVYKPDKIYQMISESNIDLLVKIPGMGRKTAERLILELKDKVGSCNYAIDINHDDDSYIMSKEAIDALVGLGFTKKESEDAITKIIQKLLSDNKDCNIEILIKMALLELN